MPEIGEIVHVWPHPGRNVRSHAELNRTLPAEGMELPWSAWLEEQLGQGMVHLTNPAQQVAPDEAARLIASSQSRETKAAAAPDSPKSPPVELPAAAPDPTSNEGK